MKCETKAILVAEDDLFLNQIIANYLRGKGFKVDSVKNGSETLKKIKENKYNLVLLDLIMPKKNGFEVLEELKEFKKKVPPIVIFSNLSQVEDEKEALGLGATAYYVKHNVALEKLIGIVKKYSR
jgi:DNA-binding response OmpR family regulator